MKIDENTLINCGSCNENIKISFDQCACGKENELCYEYKALKRVRNTFNISLTFFGILVIIFSLYNIFSLSILMLVFILPSGFRLLKTRRSLLGKITDRSTAYRFFKFCKHGQFIGVLLAVFGFLVVAHIFKSPSLGALIAVSGVVILIIASALRR